MPLIKRINSSGNSEAGIWQITESTAELLEGLKLSESELSELNGINSARTAREWIACRRLIKEMLPRDDCSLIKDEFGKPYLEGNSRHISISHTHDYAAVILSGHRTGIDIQKLDPRIERIAFKFINPAEWEIMPVSGPDRLAAIHLYWGAKEALYKLYGKKNLDFRDNMHIYPFVIKEEGSVKGHIRKEEYYEEFDIHYMQTGAYMLVYTDAS